MDRRIGSLVVGALASTIIGVGAFAVGRATAPDDDGRADAVADSVDVDEDETTSRASDPSDPSAPTGAAPARDVDLGLQSTLTVYLDALVSHDWPRAHALMCADLADRITAGGLKQELVGSEQTAGPLAGYAIGQDEVDDSGRTADVEYELQFADGAIDITASAELEGDQWRLCSFENRGGRGAFADPADGGAG